MQQKAEIKENTPKLPIGYRMYNLKGVEKTIIARKGGPSADQIKNAKSYEEVRNHQREFGIASMLAKTLRSSLSSGLSEICETYVSGKLTARFRNLAKLEEGKTGTRPLFVSKHGHLLDGFEFNPERPYSSVFGAKYFVKETAQKGKVILHFPAFTPEKTFQYPEGATNFKITARLISLSDFLFSETKNCYYPSCEDDHGKFGTYESAMLPILKMPTEPITTHVSANGGKSLDDNTGVFLIMAIRFFKYEKGSFRHLSKESAMQIHRI
ncbi:MAG: hypothetical protein WBA74_28055 [Cyclobacteriaceae bacterium]